MLNQISRLTSDIKLRRYTGILGYSIELKAVLVLTSFHAISVSVEYRRQARQDILRNHDQWLSLAHPFTTVEQHEKFTNKKQIVKNCIRIDL